MSNRYSIAQRTPVVNSLFAGLACAITLTLTAGPALAQSQDLERVEVRGRVIEGPARFDVHAACNDIAGQLQGALDHTWAHAPRHGEVKVQFVMENGEVSAVKAKGISNGVARDVGIAVHRLDCGKQASAAGPQIYRFTVAFTQPGTASDDTQTASNQGGVRVAVLSR